VLVLVLVLAANRSMAYRAIWLSDSMTQRHYTTKPAAAPPSLTPVPAPLPRRRQSARGPQRRVLSLGPSTDANTRAREESRTRWCAHLRVHSEPRVHRQREPCEFSTDHIVELYYQAT
jgi:hypothetical protein